MRVPLASSGLRASDLHAAIKTLESGNLTMGQQVKLFETEFAAYLGVKHFIMMNSGSSANLAIFETLIRPSKSEPTFRKGDGILVPSIAWPTTIWPIIQLGLVPIFVDVEIETIGIDLVKAQKKIDTENLNVRGIFPIHPLGLSLNEEKIKDFCSRNNLVYISDVCESLGAFRNGIHAGASALASSFSFYFSHHITTMEGGGVATNSDLIADDLRSVRSHGWSRDRRDVGDWNHETSLIDSKFKFVTTGFNVRPMEVQAAIGLNQIRSIDEFISRRRSFAQRISIGLMGSNMSVLDGGELDHPASLAHSWMLIPIRVNGINAPEIKRKVTDVLERFEVETRPVLTGNFLAQPAMQRIEGYFPPASDFPVATEISETCFLVGAHHDLTDSQIEYLIESLLEAIKIAQG